MVKYSDCRIRSPHAKGGCCRFISIVSVLYMNKINVAQHVKLHYATTMSICLSVCLSFNLHSTEGAAVNHDSRAGAYRIDPWVDNSMY